MNSLLVLDITDDTAQERLMVREGGVAVLPFKGFWGELVLSNEVGGGDLDLSYQIGEGVDRNVTDKNVDVIGHSVNR